MAELAPGPGLGSAPWPTLPAASGIVLAGGRSTRFGADKLSTIVDGRPLLELSMKALDPICREVVVVLAPGAPWPDLLADLAIPVRDVRDPQAHGGPLVGVVSGLRQVVHGYAIVIGGDMPWLQPEVLALLLHELARAEGSEAAALGSGGRTEQLPFAVRVGPALPVAERLAEGGERSISALLRDLRTLTLDEAVWLAFDPAGLTLRDIDRPGDLDRPADHLRHQGR